MRGYTNEQLEAKGLNVANYVGCLNCRLHWHRRVFEKHFNAPTKEPPGEAIEIIHPGWAAFLDFLAESAVKRWYADEQERLRRGEPPKLPVATAEVKTKSTKKAVRTLTVDEAVTQLGLSREEIMAEFTKHAVPFEVVLRSPPSRRGRRSRSTS